MNELETIVARQALEQANLVLKSLPTDASVNMRCNAITTAVRALTVYRDTHQPNTQQNPSSPA
ncbi:MAG: hypothetical protein JKX85_05270 [Phycisphaeraceae bacterium]|nr:hypothetical protein [Phycisphaeraceae bacterium]